MARNRSANEERTRPGLAYESETGRGAYGDCLGNRGGHWVFHTRRRKAFHRHRIDALHGRRIGFLKGLAGKAGEKVGEQLGEEHGEYNSKKIDELRGKDRPTQDRLLEDARREAEQKIIRAGLTPEQVKSIAAAVETELAKALEATAPKDVSSRIARKVFNAGLKAV